jgi:hypothetical protein
MRLLLISRDSWSRHVAASNPAMWPPPADIGAPPSPVLPPAYSLSVPAGESVLVVPLRSNAHTLLAGAPVAAMRRRLKFASLFFDKLYLEAGVFRMEAGPTGGFSTLEPAIDGTRWQTAAQRRTAQASSFQLAIGREIVPGTPAPTMSTFMESPTSHSWAATLDPFGDELPPGCDWVEWVRSPRLTSELDRVVRDWTWADDHNAALKRAIPERHLRDTVIKNANHDLVIAAASGAAATVDAFHTQVAAQRFNDDDSWKLRGYAVPLVFPHVGDLPWQAIADFRRDRGMTRFREVLREVEHDLAAEAASGDIEATANRLYRQHLAEASEAIDTVGAIGHKTLTGFVIGGYAGFLTSGIIGPLGVVAGTVAGVIPGTILDVRNMIRQRRSKSWVSLSNWIDQSG